MTIVTLEEDRVRGPAAALPFWISLTMVPVIWFSAVQGGWWVLSVPVYAWGLYSVLDLVAGTEERNADPLTDRSQLGWYRAITLLWGPVQIATLFALIDYATRAPHLGVWELVGLFFGMGVVSGTIGINYAHELLHQKPKWDRWTADLLLASVLYSHFRSEHLLVHHRHVATPRDPATARYNEGFHRFYPRVLRQSLVSAWRAEAAMLARRGLPFWHIGNPFCRYGALQAAMLSMALLLGGWTGLGLFLVQAGTAIWQLELVNYVEHYGLTRRHLGGGRYEPVRPHHSWNSARKVSNWMLINLQRHSDHHYKPDRPFPLLQTYDEEEAPQLPAGYLAMTAAAMVPPLWRRMMNPRVRAWRRRHYPDIGDWSACRAASTPLRR
ncbi:Alkane 1-monooxygenase 2 [Jannaschia seosinensis]|uniref:Alkane 1-monooxygenase 2 n=1 Tax=Jannaschia seosinensis TaxID=313367 RepID=A0A0M7B9V9_9RHOB|nr:alkane 1-monooxygenase [Jannaschia seosinensis]CUH38979.1 Alkane 1-monooxygenase 2 [Jannaschia seosinensis]